MKSRRIIGMIGGGFILALILFAAVSLSGGGNTIDPAQDAITEGVAASLIPVTFTQISETQADGQRSLRLSGIAEPGSVVALLDRGETVRQVRSTPQGVWSAIIDITDPGMAIEAILFDNSEDDPAVSEEAAVTSIRGIETIFRIEQPGELYADQPALIMVGVPGSPTRLIQSPFSGVPTEGPLSLSVIDYDDNGGVIISGVSSAPGRVRLYASNAAIGETRVGADGRWTYIASSVMPIGEYTIRAELLTDGQSDPVVAVPFERLPPLPDTGSDDGALSVSFSSYRWQVRRSLIGGGTQSAVIFAPE
ncbi:MAG: hypothetical protein AAFP97_08180 [Pseudomonadota bacterium]